MEEKQEKLQKLQKFQQNPKKVNENLTKQAGAQFKTTEKPSKRFEPLSLLWFWLEKIN